QRLRERVDPMKKHEYENDNRFWEDRIRQEGEYHLRKMRELARDLDRLKHARLLPPDLIRRITWYIELYTRPVAQGVHVGVSWEQQLRYMSSCVVGSLLLERASVRIWPLDKRVQFDPLRDDDRQRDVYLAYVSECKSRWDAWMSRMANEVVQD